MKVWVDHMLLNKSIAKLVLLLTPCIVAEAAKAEQILYCVSELQTGFFKDEGVWRTAKFASRRFTIKVEGDFKSVTLDDEIYSCYGNREFKGFFPIICNNDMAWSSQSLNIDKYSLRFVYSAVSIGGYASTANEPDTDELYAGKCERF